MPIGSRASPSFGWRTSYELQVFRDGNWIISAVFDDRQTALNEARRMDRHGRIVRLKEEQFHHSGAGQKTHTIFLSPKVKDSWKVEQDRIAARGFARTVTFGTRAPHRKGLNPYYLLAMFTLMMFMGLAAILALRTLYDSV